MRYGALCSGIGGLELAVEQVFGYEPAWHAEVNADAIRVHDRHWPNLPNIGDLTTVDWASLEHVELVCAGYPCQPFSHAGARRGADDDRHLWPHVAEAVRVLRPRWVVLENVAGHLSLGFGAVVGDLAEAGYDAEWVCVRASDVGAPHRRERVFIVATDTSRVRGSGRREAGHMAGAPGSGEGQRDQRQRPRGERRGNTRLADGDCPAADADGGRLEVGCQQDGRSSGSGLKAPRRGDTDGRDADASDTDEPGLEGWLPLLRGASECPTGTGRMVAWGDYEPAIRRWEHILGRCAPDPVDGRGRLNPPFVEWMMGYPAGWVDGLKRTAALKALGNSVVPQQGAAALSVLLNAWQVAS